MSKSKLGRHHPPAGAAGTPNGPHKVNLHRSGEAQGYGGKCKCGRCTNERLNDLVAGVGGRERY